MSEPLLTLVLPLPPSINDAYTNITVGKRKQGYYSVPIVKTVLSQKGKAYKEEVANAILRQVEANPDMARAIQETIFDYPIYLDLDFVYKDNRKRDSHNYLKVLLDTLEGVVYANDTKVYPRIQSVDVWDKKNLGTEPLHELPYVWINIVKYTGNWSDEVSKYRIEV
jgi:crossover junction endodeoxyribonuclease RusA